MRILALDTATRATAVALCDDGRSAVELRDDPAIGERPGHARRLMPLVHEAIERAATGWEALDRIAVGVGPGTFTGLRIGIATARGLSRARQIPLVGVSTLQSLALTAQAEAVEGGATDGVLAAIDARRREVFVAGWAVGDAAAADAVVGARVLGAEELTQMLRSSPRRWLAVGDGAIAFREVLERAGAVVPAEESELHRVTAISHCRLAAGLRAVAPDHVGPQYLRIPDAEIARRRTGSS